jgi:hypothetical protein
MRDSRERGSRKTSGAFHHIFWLAGGAILTVEVVVEKELTPTMSLGQVVPLQRTERPCM